MSRINLDSLKSMHRALRSEARMSASDLERIADAAAGVAQPDEALADLLLADPDALLAYRIARDLRADAELLAGATHGPVVATTIRPRASAVGFWPMALAASLVLAVVLLAPPLPSPSSSPTVAAGVDDAPVPAPLFSGSFERRDVVQAPTGGSIFDGGFDNG